MRKREKEISKSQKVSVNSQFENIDNTFPDVSNINTLKLYKILGKADYSLYQTLKKYDFSYAKCAEGEKLKLETVRTQMKRIKRNISSSLLFEEGWRHGAKILNYQQYSNINRGISKIIETVKQQKLSSLCSYFRNVDNKYLNELFNGVEYCHEWHVIFAEGIYKLYLVCAPLVPIPKFIEIIFKFNKSNFLYIISASEKKPLLIAPGTIDKVNRYKEKGKINLTEEQLLSIVSGKITNN